MRDFFLKNILKITFLAIVVITIGLNLATGNKRSFAVKANIHNPRLINGAVVNTEISLKDIVALSLFSKSGCTAKWAFEQADEFMIERAKRQ